VFLVAIAIAVVLGWVFHGYCADHSKGLMPEPVIFCYRLVAMADYEDYKHFNIVSVLQGGKSVAIDSVYDAAV
jgi:hypothetical protein